MLGYIRRVAKTSDRSAAWLARLSGGQKVESSSLSGPTIAFPIARQWLTHWRAVLFLPTYSNYGTCADSPVPENPMQRREKRPFRSVLRLLSRRFSPFEKTVDFSPNSPFSTSKAPNSPLFSWIGSHGCQEKGDENLLRRRTVKDFEVQSEKISKIKYEI